MRTHFRMAMLATLAGLALALTPTLGEAQTCFACRTNADQKHQDGEGTDDYEGSPHSGTGWHTNPCNWAHDGPVQNCGGGGGQQSMNMADYESLKRLLALDDAGRVRTLLDSRKNVSWNPARRMIQIKACDGVTVVASLRVSARTSLLLQSETAN